MKRLQIVFIFFAISYAVLACGCKQVLPETELAFCDFVLGGDFEDSYEKASMNHQYEDLSKSQDGLLEHATFKSIILPHYEYPDNPDITITADNGKIDSYQGMIYRIQFDSRWWGQTIIDMYQAKYGAVKPKRHKSYENEYVRGNVFKRTIVHIDYLWRFKNAEISVSESYRDDYGSKKDDIVTVYYTDKVSYNKAKPYLDSLFYQKITSFNDEAERNRIITEEQEREEQRIKKEKQNAILESI